MQLMGFEGWKMIIPIIIAIIVIHIEVWLLKKLAYFIQGIYEKIKEVKNG